MRKTKIVCTIGPASSKESELLALKKAGMNAARLNFSHGEAKDHEEVADRVKSIRDEDRPLAIIIDLPGPKTRVGELEAKSIHLHKGSTVKITSEEVIGTEKIIPVNAPDVSKLAKVGSLVFFDDGKIELEVVGKEEGVLECIVIVGGELFGRKGFNSPETDLARSCLTPRDLQGIMLAKRVKPEFVSQSFVRTAQDIKKLREQLPKGIGIIAKIENKHALANFDSILHETDAVMVARGDLGMQTPIEELPTRQKTIIMECNQAAKPVITATQMLESMTTNPTPTRAEVTDVANAVFDGTDAIMLSGETALGNHPARVVEVMNRIAESAEKHLHFLNRPDKSGYGLTSALSLGASQLARETKAKAIVTCTTTGQTARLVSRDKPEQPIIAVTAFEKTFQQLALSWGVKPYLIKRHTKIEDLIKEGTLTAKEKLGLKKGDFVVVTGGELNVAGSTNMLRVETV